MTKTVKQIGEIGGKTAKAQHTPEPCKAGAAIAKAERLSQYQRDCVDSVLQADGPVTIKFLPGAGKACTE